ncbi:MAG: NAD kinase [Bacteroidales bacterium]|nr:MAG: NAD kinase [Bacteroidales bacterium]
MKIAIFGTTYDKKYNKLLETIIQTLNKNAVEMVFEQFFFSFVKQNSDICLDNITKQYAQDIDADIAISFGGDGTFLATAKLLLEKNILILGINAGHLGFLADVPEKEIETVLSEIIDGKYKIERRAMLRIELSDKKYGVFRALNEVALLRQDTASMIEIDMTIEGEDVTSYKSDGLIISTPTGSTAYSLSLGGPIISPKSENFLIVPLAPHSLTVRPLVIPDNCQIELKVYSRSGNYQVAIDGQSINLPDSTTVKIEKSDYMVQCIQPLNHTFFKTIRDKLKWGV